MVLSAIIAATHASVGRHQALACISGWQPFSNRKHGVPNCGKTTAVVKVRVSTSLNLMEQSTGNLLPSYPLQGLGSVDKHLSIWSTIIGLKVAKILVGANWDVTFQGV